MSRAVVGVLLSCLGLCSHAGGQTITSVTTADGGPVIAQNTFIVIKGTNLVPADTPPSGIIWSDAPSFASGLMPTELGGVSVTVNNNPAFVYFYCSAATDPQCSQDQINILTPLDNTIGPAPVVVTSGAISSPPFSAILQPVAPSFLLFSPAGYIAATHANNALLGPATLYPGSSTPASAGEVIQLYAVGFGLPETSLVDGSASQSGSLPVLPGCQVGGAPADLAFAGLTGPGVYQLNLTIPAAAANGDNTISCTYNAATTPVGDLITVQSSTPSPTLEITTSGTGGGTFASSPAGTSCGKSYCLSFPAGTAVTLSATPNAGSVFTGWSGPCSGTDTCTVTMILSQTVTATFTLAPAAQQTLLAGNFSAGGTCDNGGPNWNLSATLDIVTQPSLSSLAAAGGSFTGVWNGIQTAGVECPSPQSGSTSNSGTVAGVVQPGGATTVTLGGGTLSCVPAGTGTVTSISGTFPAGCFVGSNGRATGSGTFQVSALPAGLGTVLTTVTAGSGSGTIVASPPGTSCGSNCLAFATGTVVTLTARANSGSTFTGWTGACSGTGKCTVTITASLVVTATFNVTALIPAVYVSPTSLNIVLPNNQTQSFTIANTGAAGSTMDYFVVDTSGYLNLQSLGAGAIISGTLSGGQSTQVNVNVLAQFAAVTDPYDVFWNQGGSTDAVAVLTPQASNYVKLGVSFNILESFNVNVSVVQAGDVPIGVAASVETDWGATIGSAIAVGGAGVIAAPGNPGDRYQVVIPSGQGGSDICTVVSGESGEFGPDMPTAVINCI